MDFQELAEEILVEHFGAYGGGWSKDKQLELQKGKAAMVEAFQQVAEAAAHQQQPSGKQVTVPFELFWAIMRVMQAIEDCLEHEDEAVSFKGAVYTAWLKYKEVECPT